MEKSFSLLAELTFSCKHCGRKVPFPQLLLTVATHGIVFLFGESEGYWGVTCPHEKCRKLSLSKGNINEVKAIRSLFDTIPTEIYFEKQILKYFAVPHSFEAIINRPDHCLAFETVPVENITNNYPFLYPHQIPSQEEAPLDFSAGYYTYLANDGVIGPRFMVQFINKDLIEKLEVQENKTGKRIFPRYFFEDDLLAEIEDFCYKYKFRPEEAKIINKKLEGYVRVIEVNVGPDEKTIDRNYDFLKILIRKKEIDYNSAYPSSFNILMESIFNYCTMFGAQIDKSIMRKPIIINSNEFPTAGQLQEINSKFDRGYVQTFLTSQFSSFIEDYYSLTENASFEISQVWELKNRYLKMLHDAVKVSSLEKSRYAFFPEGDTWTIIFDGKPVKPLIGEGFKYIEYLVRHSGRKYHTVDLARLVLTDDSLNQDYPQENAAQILQSKDFRYVVERSQEIGDEKYREEIDHRLEELDKKIKEMDAGKDKESKKKLQEERAFLLAFKSKDLGSKKHPRTFQTELKTLRNKITKSIERAVKSIKKRDENLGKHFKNALSPINSEIQSYSPDINITWKTK